MSKVKRALDSKDSHIKTLRIVIAILTLIIAYSQWGWSQAPKNITVDIPPDLRSGSSRLIGEKHPYNVYSYGLYIWQQINSWPVSGEEDYKKNIERLSCYITPKFKAELLQDYNDKGRRAELKRTRYIQEMHGRGYQPERVFIESKDSWVAYYDIGIKESYRGQKIKDIYARYPLRIVRMDANPECNPWALAIDGIYEKPKRIEVRETEMEATTGEVQQ